jgi:hypothetical protein
VARLRSECDAVRREAARANHSCCNHEFSAGLRAAEMKFAQTGKDLRQWFATCAGFASEIR